MGKGRWVRGWGEEGQAETRKDGLSLTSFLVASALGDVGFLWKLDIRHFVIVLNTHLVQKSEKLKQDPEEDGAVAGLVTVLCQRTESAG